jgi:hypothetical protein
VICLGIVGLGLALSLRHQVPAAAASAPTTTHNSGAMAGVRLPGAYPEPTEPNPLPRSRFHPTEPMAVSKASTVDSRDPTNRGSPTRSVPLMAGWTNSVYGRIGQLMAVSKRSVSRLMPR